MSNPNKISETKMRKLDCTNSKGKVNLEPIRLEIRELIFDELMTLMSKKYESRELFDQIRSILECVLSKLETIIEDCSDAEDRANRDKEVCNFLVNVMKSMT